MSEETSSAVADVQPEAKMTVNRQEFLNLAWLASLGFVVLQITAGTVVFAYPRLKEGEFGGIFTYGPVSGLPAADAAPQNFPKVKVWISNNPEGLFALYKVCVHLGCIYGWNDQEFKFICPCHGSQYQHNGTYIQGPAPRSLDRFVIQIVDPATGAVVAETPTDGGPLPVPDDPNLIIRVDTGKKITGEVHA